MKSLKNVFQIASLIVLATACASGSQESGSTQTTASSSEKGQVIVHQLPKLPYAYQALEPHLDARTMEIHHDKHHRAYVDNLNKALVGSPLATKTIEEIVRSPNLPAAIRNNGGGHYNHSLFWSVMAPVSQKANLLKKGSALEQAIVRDFGSVEKFKELFTQAALTRFGSGWAWLVLTADSKLAVTSTNAQDNPLMQISDVTKGTPVLGLDVWEHAYYLKFQNRRPDYVKAWWNVVNWSEVEKRFAQALASK